MTIQRKINLLKWGLGIVSIALSFLVFTTTKAQLSQCWNGSWTEPSCDPLTDLTCNVSPPLFSYASCLQGTSGELRIFKYNADGNELDDISQNPTNWTQLMPGYIGVGDVQSGWVPYSVSTYGYGDGIIQINRNLLVGHFTSQPSGTFTGTGDAAIQYDLNVGKQLRVDGGGATSYIYAPLQVLPGTISGDGLFIQGNGFDAEDNVVRILNTGGGGGQGTVLYLQQSNGDFGYFLKMDGWQNDVDVDYLGYFNSTGDFQIRIDRDNNSANYFRLNNGSNSTVLQVDESGNLLAQGNITTNGQFCLGSDCIASWNNVGYWNQNGSYPFPNNLGWQVGIGTNAPSSIAKMEVVGNILLNNNSNNAAVIINPSQNGVGVDPMFRMQTAETGSGNNAPMIISRNAYFQTSDNKYRRDNTSRESQRILFDNNGDIIFSSADADADPISWSDNLIIKLNGDVGIGITDPNGYKLYVNGDAYSTGSWNSSDICFSECENSRCK